MTTITLHESPSPEIREVIITGLRAYNESKAGPPNILPAMIALADDSGAVVGGISAHTAFGWMFVELLFVPENMRGTGQGQALMNKAEETARARGCVGIWLDTFSFQARGFYEKLGYGVFGQLDNYPGIESRFYMSKRL